MGCRQACRPETENGMNTADTIQLLILIVMAIQLGLEIAKRKQLPRTTDGTGTATNVVQTHYLGG